MKKLMFSILSSVLLLSCSVSNGSEEQKLSHTYGVEKIKELYPKSNIVSVRSVDIYNVFNESFSTDDLELLNKYGYLYTGGKDRTDLDTLTNEFERDYLQNSYKLSYENLVTMGKVKCESVCFTVSDYSMEGFVYRDGIHEYWFIIND